MYVCMLTDFIHLSYVIFQKYTDTFTYSRRTFRYPCCSWL